MTTTPALPELGDDRVALIEQELFARIADEPSPAPVAVRPRRGRVWVGALGGAAAAVVALVVLPAIGAAVVGGSQQSGAAGSAVAGPATIPEDGSLVQPAPADGSALIATDAAAGAVSRTVVATGTATVQVADVAAAIAAIGADATARGGYVESTSTDAGSPVPIDGYGDSGYPSSGYGSITVRVPADELAEATAALAAVGEVTASAVSQQDVTDQTIDLSARVASLQATVDRLNALVGQAQNVQDVIAVESELSARQADLESYRQQLQYLQGQVSLSALSVTVVLDTTPVAADPAGFGDGLAAGWNGLVATVNALVVAVGFLLPWLGVAAVAALVVWLVVRAVRRRGGRPAPTGGDE